MIDRAELGVDGNCGFALLGENIQDGEAEFVEFKGDIRTSEGHINARHAAFRALHLLRVRTGLQISYYLGKSHLIILDKGRVHDLELKVKNLENWAQKQGMKY